MNGRIPKEWWVYEDSHFYASFYTEKEARRCAHANGPSGCRYAVLYKPLKTSPYFVDNIKGRSFLGPEEPL